MNCLQEDGTRSTEVWSIFAALIFLQVLKRYVPVKRVFLDFVVIFESAVENYSDPVNMVKLRCVLKSVLFLDFCPPEPL